MSPELVRAVSVAVRARRASPSGAVNGSADLAARLSTFGWGSRLRRLAARRRTVRVAVLVSDPAFSEPVVGALSIPFENWGRSYDSRCVPKSRRGLHRRRGAAQHLQRFPSLQPVL